MMGSGYVIDHCMSALRKSREEDAFRMYIADGLYAIVTNELTYARRFEEILEAVRHPKTKSQKAKEKAVHEAQNKQEARRIQNRLRAKLQGD